jgi:hypothetical protein
MGKPTPHDQLTRRWRPEDYRTAFAADPSAVGSFDLCSCAEGPGHPPGGDDAEEKKAQDHRELE